jgi:DNA-binding transcriptional LysR family regulator
MGAVVVRDLEVRHCRVLIAVHDQGSVAAAAQTLGLAQSTVSETLSSLGRIVGAPAILRRPGREARLTATAEALLPHARAVVLAVETALGAVIGRRDGNLRVGAVESISSFLLPAPLGRFRSRRPGWDVRISVGLCEELRRRVARGELDLALTIEEAAFKDVHDVQTRTATASALRLVASPRNALAGRRVGPRTLAARTLLLADAEGAFTRLITCWFESAGARAALQSAGSLEGVKRALRDSDLVGVLPDFAVAEDIALGRLIDLETTSPLPAVALFLTTLEGRRGQGALGDLVEEIDGAFNKRSQEPRGAAGSGACA